MGDMVIAVYRPKPGRERELEEVVREHVPTLRRLGLATGRPALAMRAANGEVVEVFEWREGAIAAAHGHAGVLAMWERFGDVCDHAPLQSLAESQAPFAQFRPIDD